MAEIARETSPTVRIRRPKVPGGAAAGVGVAGGAGSIGPSYAGGSLAILGAVTDLPTTAFIAVAVAALVVPLGFLGMVVIAAMARRRGEVLGPRLSAALSLGGGLALGSMVLVVATDLEIAAPFLIVAGVLVANEWRGGRRASAGWLLAGTAMPWTILWGLYLGLLAAGEPFDPLPTVRSFAIGALPAALGLIVAGRFGGATADVPRAPARSFLVISSALREPSRVGPIGLPELAAVVTLAVIGVVAALLPVRLPALAEVAVVAVLASAAASEAYLRAMAPRARRAMEAFLWLGDWSLAAARAMTGGGVPTTRSGAERWLTGHPAAPDEPALMRSLRVQVLLLAGRVADAQAIADLERGGTPAERFSDAADRELLRWWTGGPTDVTAMRAAAEAILPPDGDDRARADVTIALAETRGLAVADPPLAGDPLAPLLVARDRLGVRADGVLRRLLWRRMFAVFLVLSMAIGVLGLFGVLGGAIGA